MLLLYMDILVAGVLVLCLLLVLKCFGWRFLAMLKTAYKKGIKISPPPIIYAKGKITIN